ncbi:MAG: antibiotic biosynthesis monooxygenase [Thermomicrobiales bacterium]
MYARVTTVQVRPDMQDEASRITRDAVIPALKDRPGFGGFFLLTDRSTSQGLAISLWESEADLHATEASGHYREQLGKLATAMAGPPTMAIYEVEAQG